jgi:hypothetical protein
MNIQEFIKDNNIYYDLINKKKDRILNIYAGQLKIYNEDFADDEDCYGWEKYDLNGLEISFRLFLQILFDDWEMIKG